MTDTYKTIAKASEGIYKEKGSKFIAFAIPANNTEEVKKQIVEYRKKYYDARHLCYAYMLGNEKKEWRSNDDGEPSGTAGRPILGQINSHELTNILVIVVRYFGGVLLGTGGLVVAYKEATSDALQQAEIIEKIVVSTIQIHFEYPLMNEVMRLIKEGSANIINQGYDQDCQMEISVRKMEYPALLVKLEKLDGVVIHKVANDQ